ncbi:hypothetical protein Q1695_013676 [Nippostrongylus brasiliensis]|nr:hypothetical protein Q1695_013676 [Nippostrongylus brasiliensis]
MTEKLHPFEALEDDYYMGEEARGGGGRISEEELSSDDELQQELCKLAGIKRECVQKRRKEKHVKTEFEMDMEYELDQLITDYANEHLSGNVKRPEGPSVSCREFIKQCAEEEMPALCDDSDEESNEGRSEPAVPSKRVKFEDCPSSISSTFDEKMDVSTASSSSSFSHSKRDLGSSDVAALQNKPSRPLTTLDENRSIVRDCSKKEEEENPIKKTANEFMKDLKEAPDFYDPEEDDQSEKWVQQRRKQTTGLGGDANTTEESRPRIDGDSDAVLSCPGCMVMLTRDCQRHEIYSGQFRAMFVENCRVDQKSMKIERTGKEKRREKQKIRKMEGDRAAETDSASDLFLPVHCAVCSTNVAVMDHDEVYHFFNVLTGYA